MFQRNGHGHEKPPDRLDGLSAQLLACQGELEHICAGTQTLVARQDAMTELAAQMAGLAEQMTTEFHRQHHEMQRLDGRLERLELWLTSQFDSYPDTQANIRNLDDWRRLLAERVARSGGG